MSYTPMMKQYLEIKQNYRDSVLFFRLGDFYEMFFDDAILASRELEIALTGRDAGGENKVPMCGIPYHAADTYIAKLIEKNHKVAICEQVEDPKSTRGLVRREVTRVITPGTILESKLLDDKKYNYIVSLALDNGVYGLAAADISTGLFMCTRFNEDKDRTALIDELTRLRPAEILLSEEFADNKLLDSLRGRISFSLTSYPQAVFLRERAASLLKRYFGPGWQRSGLDMPASICAAGGMLAYLEDTQKRELNQLKSIQVYSTGQFMLLDGPSRRNLELTVSIRDGSRWGTLLWVLDHTVTAMGGRLLKSWLEQPLLDVSAIEERLDAISESLDNIFLHHDLRRLLSNVYDLERLAARVVYGTANARDLLALRTSLAVLPELKEILQECKSSLWLKIAGHVDALEGLSSLLASAIADDPPISVREGRLIKDGYNKDVDRLREASRNGKAWLAELEAREKKRTGIKSLKVGYNKVFGYYIEITRSNLDLAPPDYIRKQTLANAERFITPELKELEEQILGAEDRLVQLEYQLFTEVREQIAMEVGSLQQSARAVAKIDALQSLAEAAVRGNYIRPMIKEQGRLFIKEGRHPVVEKVLGPGQFVPNDISLGDENRLVILTGPNMAGKSTYMRQVALLVLMAQIGSFIPAAEACIGVVDRIFTRVGAADDLAGGQSTFMVEMSECQVIVNSATEKSLIIMDEVGRGTSTYDGMSIARALAEYIATNIRAKTLFSTHYHELTDLEELHGVINYTVAVEEQGEDIIFLRRVLPGRADRSYGIQVARLAGLPVQILDRAGEILHALEFNRNCNSVTMEQVAATAMEPTGSQFNCHRNTTAVLGEHPVLKEIVELDLLNVTPLQALSLISEWQEQLKIPGNKKKACSDNCGSVLSVGR